MKKEQDMPAGGLASRSLTVEALRGNSITLSTFNRDAFDKIKEPFFLKKADGTILYVNKAASDLFGFQADALQNQRDSEVLPLEVSNFTRLKDTEAIIRGTADYEVAVPLSSGMHRFLVHKRSFVETATQETLIAGWAVMDKTYPSQDLPESLKQLDYENPWGELINKLQVARKEAAQAKKTKANFLGNVSHELRTPLNGIMGMAQLLEATDLDEEQTECLSMIRHAAYRLLGTVNDLLALSRLESRQIRIADEPFSIRDMLDPIQLWAETQASLKGLEFQWNVDNNLGNCFQGDPQRITQILMNLLSNAVKFTTFGTVSFSARQALMPAGHDSRSGILFVIKDTGIGISEEKQQIIFDSFEQGEELTTRQFEGLGAGLSIARQFAELMHGHILLDSKEGKGSTFSVWLPITGIENCKRSGCRNDFGMIRPLRILLVESDPVNQHLFTKLLQRLGDDVEALGNEQEAADLLKETRFDVLIVNISRHVSGNGKQLTRTIRSGLLPGVPADLPIIGASSHASEVAKREGLDAGLNTYMRKPFGLAELQAALLPFRKN